MSRPGAASRAELTSAFSLNFSEPPFGRRRSGQLHRRRKFNADVRFANGESGGAADPVLPPRFDCQLRLSPVDLK
jgi:hypothetical protein